jgi:hypothetical protein
VSVFPSPEEVQLRNLDRFDKIIDSITSLSARVEELLRGMAAIAEVAVAKVDLDDTLKDYALQNDLDSLRSEMYAAISLETSQLQSEMLDRIAEATATPFDPERPA